jgi:hypothetical protein
MFDKTRDHMNNWRRDNPRAFGNQVDRSIRQTPSLGNVKRSAVCFSWYGSHDFRAKIEPPSCHQYKPGDCLAVRPLKWDVIIDEDVNNNIWVDSGATSGVRSLSSDGNIKYDSDSEEDTLGGEKGTRKGKGTKDGKGKGKGKATEEGKGKGKGNGKGQGQFKQTPGGDNISRAVAVQLQNEFV